MSEHKILSVVAAILFAVVGWMFNKVIEGSDEIRVNQEQLRITLAVIEERVNNAVHECKED
jgi:hypothetical protein